MGWVLLSIGLVLVVEGLAYVLAPSLIERLLEMLRTLPIDARRQVGALAFVSGLILVYGAFLLGVG
ncbi:MAG: DUF2065 domain-containing protein [Pseudomonadota bacterium]